MDHINSMHIRGFKKFYSLDIDFNEHMNIIVGENEAGKSTILEALKTVLNQQYRNFDKAILKDLFNQKMVSEFLANPSIKTLPSITMEVELALQPDHKNAEYFYGESYSYRKSNEVRFGVKFECQFDRELGFGLEDTINKGKIPYEYYSLTWTTYGNHPYQIIKRPLKFLAIDTSSNNSAMSFNYYNRSLFTNKFDEDVRIKAKNEFRDQLDKAFENIGLPQINDHRKFGVDSKKVILETILSVYEDSIALENHGSGMESLIKTQIALDRQSNLDVILIEEPENHLCFSSLRKMLEEISAQQNTSQIIIATHNNMITSRLNLMNVLWITENKVQYLKDINKDVADFFVKADDNAFLQLLLSKKAILVEGATEFLLIPYIYNQIKKCSIESDEITVISCNGISYKKYLAIAKETGKRIAVITDNDKNQEKIEYADNFNVNEENKNQHIFMDNDIENWTWEACFYNLNKDFLDNLIEIKPKSKYLFYGVDYGKVLGKMLNNKVDSAYKMLCAEEDYAIPKYVKDAIEWISE